MKCDIAIVGAGPAGLTAAIYGARAGMSVKLIEMGVPGGQLVNTDWIENYPGFPEGLSGPELMQNFTLQATGFPEVELLMGHVHKIEPIKEGFVVTYGDQSLLARTVIIAAGANPKELGVPGEKLLTGAGVSYCAVCDGAFFREKTVAVVGGGDTALEDAVFLTKFARKVYLIHRRGEFRGAKILQDRVFANEKIEPLLNRTITEIQGKGKVENLVLKDVESGQTSDLAVDGVFILVGTRPNSDWIQGFGIETDAAGYVAGGTDMETKVPGIFVAGDVRKKTLRQVSTAVGDGAMAAMSAVRYLEENQ